MLYIYIYHEYIYIYYIYIYVYHENIIMNHRIRFYTSHHISSDIIIYHI